MNQMQVYLDDTPCDVDCQTLAHAIADAAAQAEQAGRLIVEVMVDGESWTQQQLSGEDMTQATANEVRMTSVDPTQLRLIRSMRSSARLLSCFSRMSVARRWASWRKRSASG